MKRSRKMTLALFIAIGIVGLLLIIGSMNVGGDIVRREAAKAVAEVLGADLTIQGVTGNPIRGYRLSDISLKKKEDVLLSAGALGVKVNLMSVFSGNPRLSQVTIDGIEADGEKLAREIAALDLKGEGGEIPVEAVTIRNGKVRTPWGEASIAKTDLVLKADSVKADLDIAMNNVPIKGPINLRKGKDDLELKGLDLKVGDGRISAKGAILPSLSLKGEMEKLDVGQVVQFWPQLPVDGYKGLFSSTISIGGLWNDPVLEGRLSFSGTSLAGYPVQAIDSDWKYGAFRLSLENLKAKALALPLSGRAAFAFAPGKVPSMDILMEGKDASLEELKGTVPALASVKGRVDSFSVAVKGTLATLSGNIDLKADQVEAYGQQLKNTVAHVVFKGSGATIQGSSSLEGGSLALSGSVDQLQRAPRLNVLLKARSIDVGKIIASLPKPPKITPKGSVSADIGVKGSMADPRVDGTVWSDRMAYGEEALNDLNTAFVFHKDRVTLSSARGRWRNIPITGRGTIAGVSKAAPSLDLSFQARLELRSWHRYQACGGLWAKNRLHLPGLRL
jgi:autotransporter translocation and assembly factor TamB